MDGTALFDVDGTLVDSNYQHALSWYRATSRRRPTRIPALGVRTGGWAAAELVEAGASAVFESLPELRSALDSTPLSAPDQTGTAALRSSRPSAHVRAGPGGTDAPRHVDRPVELT